MEYSDIVKINLADDENQVLSDQVVERVSCFW